MQTAVLRKLRSLVLISFTAEQLSNENTCLCYIVTGYCAYFPLNMFTSNNF